jgi:diaminopimelate epimerase
MRFRKMHGAGNDFIMIDGRNTASEVFTAARIEAVCNRRTGIGADGLIVLLPEDDPAVDFRMVYFNADGHEAEMCGNGARCSVAFARDLDWIGAECRFATHEGILTGRIVDKAGTETEVEVSLPAWRDLQLHFPVAQSPWTDHHTCNTGVPHLVIPVADVEPVDVTALGRQFRHQAEFAPAGTNVNWVAPAGENTTDGRPIFQIRTYERGVEAETLACGTGASAAAVVLCHLEEADSPVVLRTRKGDLLRVTVERQAAELFLQGPAVTSFQGEVASDE